MISIIVPIFKAEETLPRCLDSIKLQTFDNWEAILVDDGSPDNSAKICDDYAIIDSRFKVIHKNNEGVAMARQTGLDTAKGDYVIHIDPDDWVEKTMLEDLYNKAIIENADMVICDYYIVQRESTKYTKQEPSSLNNDIILREMYEGEIQGSLWNKLVKSSLFNEYHIRFQKGMSLMEDVYVIVALLMHNIKVAYLPGAYYHYVVGKNPNSLSNNDKNRTYEYDKLLYEKFEKLTRGHNYHGFLVDFYANRLLGQAYNRHDFTSWQFFRYCTPYVFKVRSGPMTVRLKYFLSCFGFYTIIWKLKSVIGKHTSRHV